MYCRDCMHWEKWSGMKDSDGCGWGLCQKAQFLRDKLIKINLESDRIHNPEEIVGISSIETREDFGCVGFCN